MNFPSEHGRVFSHQQAPQGTVLVATVPCVGEATTDVTTTEVINVGKARQGEKLVYVAILLLKYAIFMKQASVVVSAPILWLIVVVRGSSSNHVMNENCCH